MAPSRKVLAGIGLVLALGLAGCGLGPDNPPPGDVRDPVVAATVNGRAIYIEDVRAHAVARGLLQEGEDLDGNSNAFHNALEELIQVRLFAMEAEARGLDREADVRRRLENAREWVLANSIYEEIEDEANNPAAIRRLYDENASQLGQGTEVHLRHIQFSTREAAEAAKRRLDQGERFEALAFELSTERNTAPDGGDLGWSSLSDVAPPIRAGLQSANIGEVMGPIQVEDTWHIVRYDDRRERGGPSLETLRPRIVNWLRFQQITQLQERLERDARIERLREPEPGLDPGEEVTAPADAEENQPLRPAPDAGGPPGQAAPPFPFPLGPGGVVGGAQPQQQAPTAQAAPPTPAPAPAAPAEQSEASEGATE
jgi:peptidyl-prolyl cis-trans isomerase C